MRSAGIHQREPGENASGRERQRSPAVERAIRIEQRGSVASQAMCNRARRSSSSSISTWAFSRAILVAPSSATATSRACAAERARLSTRARTSAGVLPRHGGEAQGEARRSSGSPPPTRRRPWRPPTPSWTCSTGSACPPRGPGSGSTAAWTCWSATRRSAAASRSPRSVSTSRSELEPPHEESATSGRGRDPLLERWTLRRPGGGKSGTQAMRGEARCTSTSRSTRGRFR